MPVALLGVFFVYPVASIIGRGLTPGGTLDLSPLGAVVTDPHLRGVAWFTIWQATVSTALTVLVALPGAYVFARYEFRGKRLVRAAVLVPFVLPTVVVGSAFSCSAKSVEGKVHERMRSPCLRVRLSTGSGAVCRV